MCTNSAKKNTNQIKKISNKSKNNSKEEQHPPTDLGSIKDCVGSSRPLADVHNRLRASSSPLVFFFSPNQLERARRYKPP